MSHRAIRPKVPIFIRRPRWTSLSPWYFIPSPTANPAFATTSPLHRHLKPNSNSTLGITTLFQARFHATMPRPITDAERARMQAYQDALDKAMSEITEYDPDRVREACAAVANAHPIDDALRDAFSAEHLREMAGPDEFKSIDEALNCRVLKPDTPWGMVVYRVSYGDDGAWERMLAQINKGATEYLEELGHRQDMLARHRLVVMDDHSQFDGATPDQVREHFTKWAVDELKRNWREQPMPDDEFAKLETGDGVDKYHSLGARYNFCLLIDDICLESLDKMFSPVMKLVTRNWAAGEQDLEGKGEEEWEDPGYEGGVSNNEFEDVGWMYKDVSEYVDIQESLHDPSNWVDDYKRPPLRSWDDEYETAPGFWRRNRKPSDGQ